MANLTLLIFFIFVLLTFNSGGGRNLEVANAMEYDYEMTTWCVARPSTSDTQLMDNLAYACSEVDCGGLLDPDFPCHDPDTMINHASVAMNLYYQIKGRTEMHCNFKSSGLRVITDPSYEGCTYKSIPYAAVAALPPA